MSICCLTGSSSASILGPSARNPVATISSSRRGFRLGEQVAGELLLHEPVVRLVGVERGDHVIAITPGVGIGEVVVHAVAVGVARRRPASAGPSARRNEAKPAAGRRPARRPGPSRRYKNASISSGAGAGPRGRASPGGAGPLVSRRRRPQPGGFEPRQDEAVDRRAGPGASTTVGGVGTEALKRPERPGLLVPWCGACRLATVPAPGESGQGAPILTHAASASISAWRELRLRRHRHGAIVAHGQDQQALVRLAADDRRAGSPPRRSDSSESTRSFAFPSPESGPWQR